MFLEYLGIRISREKTISAKSGFTLKIKFDILTNLLATVGIVE